MSSITGKISILIIKHSENGSMLDLARRGLLRPFRGQKCLVLHFCFCKWLIIIYLQNERLLDYVQTVICRSAEDRSSTGLPQASRLLTVPERSPASHVQTGPPPGFAGPAIRSFGCGNS